MFIHFMDTIGVERLNGERKSATFTSHLPGIYVMFCVMWYHLYNFKKMKKPNGGVLLLVKFQTWACTFTKSNTPLWVFFTFFKFPRWHSIAQDVSFELINDIWKMIVCCDSVFARAYLINMILGPFKEASARFYHFARKRSHNFQIYKLQ